MGYIRTTFTYDGKRYQVYGKTAVECGEKKAKKLQELKEQRNIRSGNVLLKDWANFCIETYKVNLKDSTKKKYISRMNSCVLNALGNYPIKNIKSSDIQMCINKQEGKSQWYIKQTKDMLNFLFEKAVDNDMIYKNPVRNITLPKGTKQIRRALTDEERQVFLDVCKDDKYLVFLLTYYLGCRPNEARELKDTDIFYIDNQPYMHIKGTKTENADRNVPIPDELYKRIKNEKGYIAKTIQTKKHIDERRYRMYWHSLKRDMNILMGCQMYRNGLIKPYPLDENFVPYYLRHDYCTRLAINGCPMSIASKLMGHSDIRLTASIYQHLTNDMLIEANKYVK